MKHKFKRISSLIVALAMIISMIPGFTLTAHAAGSLNTISGLTASWTDASSPNGSASWSASGTSITGTATGYKQTIIPKTVTTNLTLTNSSGSEATLSFDYTLEGDGSVSGISGNSYSGVLADGASLTITLTSPSGANTNTLRITGLSLISTSAGDVTTTFKPTEGGSYTVAEGSGTAEEITAETAKTSAAGTEYTVSATPASGYQFFGWYNETTGEIMSYDTPYTFKASADMTLVPKFISSTTAVFGVGVAKFDNLTEAGEYAATGSVKTIVLLNDGTVSGSHTIPAGTTLLIPFDDSNTLYTTAPESTSTKGTIAWTHNSWEQPKPYRILTLAADADITVNGAISLSAKHHAGGSRENAGSPSGPCSFMNMTEDSHITLNSGAALYAWGYVTGSGTITAKSGSAVYENFQIRDFRGGSATSAMANDGLVFPLSQYYVQNVEVSITYESGAEEWVYTSLYMSSMSRVFSASVKFVGSDAMFQPQKGGSVTKTYIGSSDRLKIDVRGNATLSAIALSISTTQIDSAKYILPINSNIDINILSGTTSLSQDLALLPGSAMSVAQGATLNISDTDSPSGTIESGKGYNLFVYDADEWTYGYDGDLNRVDDVKYVHSGYRLVPLSYAPGRTYNRTASDLKDVVLDVNGTITTNGFLFTTAGGASIISSDKTGEIVMVNGAGTEEYTYQATQSGSDITYYAIPVTSAQLRNGDGTYTETAGAAAGDTYVYIAGKDKWVKEGEVEEITITFDANGGDGSMDPQTANSGEDAVLTGNSFTREHYTFKEWNTASDGSGTSYENGAIVNFTEDTTLYAQWQFWNGWLTDEIGTTYYLEGEQPYKSQWQTIDGNTYYFNEQGYIVKGIYKTNSQDGTYEAMFVFDDTTGIFLSDKSGLHDVGADTYWIQNGEVVEEAGLQRVVTETGEVNYYYFAVQKNVEENPDLEVTKAVKNLLPEGGRDCWIHKTNDLPLPEWGYYFDENGVILHNPDTSKNGILEDEGVLYYYVDGIKAPAGLIKIDDDYYYANSKGQLIVDQTYYCSRTNGLLPEGTYAFNGNGKMMIGDTNKNGIVEENGSLYYYVDGQLTYAGLIQIDGDYYYVKSNCEVVHGCSYWISKTNGLLDQGTYTFDDNGKMLPSKDGIFSEDDSLYYYENGVRTYAGLIQIGGDYYYVKSNCEVIHGCSYWISKTNGLLPEGNYTFDDDGKIQLPEVDLIKDGIVAEDGSLYYYANGVRTYAGLIQIDGDYYYVRSNCEVVHGQTYYISWTHGLMDAGVYTFDEDGKMIS